MFEIPITDTSLYRKREDIVSEMLAQLVAAISDAHTGEDGSVRIIFEIEAGQMENLYLAHQILLEDSFITTASVSALERFGEDYTFPMKIGTQAEGTVTFEGLGGTDIPIGTEVGYDPGSGLDEIFFFTTSDAQISNPGTPDPLVAGVNVTAGNLNGLYEYVVTFVTGSAGIEGPLTPDGETLPSADSNAQAYTNQQGALTAIPLGGTGTIWRRIYRQKNGSGIYRLVGEIQDNTTTTFNDNATDAAMAAGALAPTVDTSHRATVYAQAQEVGVEGNVGIGTITALTNAPTLLTAVTNTIPFENGTDPEDTEDYRARLLEFIRSPGTGAPQDLKVWAERVEGVQTATVFPNTPTAGTSTVRIAGPNGSVPSADVISEVQNTLDALDLANMTIIVSSFTAVPTNVTIDVTPSGTYSLADVTPSAQQAVSDYILGLPVGGTMYLAGIVDAVFGLSGVDDVVVTSPATNQTTAATDKRTPGTIAVT